MNPGALYDLFLTLAFGSAFAWFVRAGLRRGHPRALLIDLCLAALAGGIGGARVLHVVAEPLPSHPLDDPERARLEQLAAGADPELAPALRRALARPELPASWAFAAELSPGAARSELLARLEQDPARVPAWLYYRARPDQLLAFWNGGLAFLGGLLLAAAAGAGLARWRGMPVGEAADLAAPAVMLGLAIGRLGCSLGGCCYGQVCAPAWWAGAPPWVGPPAGGVPRYPTALLDAANAALVFAVLRWLLPRRRFQGEVFLALPVLYGPGRFLGELLRDDPRGGAAGLSTSQLLLLALALPAALLWVVGRLRSAGAPATERPPPGP